MQMMARRRSAWLLSVSAFFLAMSSGGVDAFSPQQGSKVVSRSLLISRSAAPVVVDDVVDAVIEEEKAPLEAIEEATPLELIKALALSTSATAEEYCAALQKLPTAVDAVRALDAALESNKQLLTTASFACTLDLVSAAVAPPSAYGALVGHVMGRMRKAEVDPDDAVLVALGGALLKARKNKEALASIDAASASKRRGDSEALRIAIIASARMDDAVRVREATEAALRGGADITAIDDATLKFAMKVLAKAGDYRTPFAMVTALPEERRSTPLYHAAITACGKAKPAKGKTAMLLWRRMKADGCEPIPRATYNALLHAAQSSEIQNATTAILAEMSQKNVSLNVVSYNIALSSLARKGRFAEMLTLLEGMESQKITPTEITFGTAIFGAAQANNSAAAMELLRAQNRMDIMPADAAFGAALEACLRDPDGAAAANVAAGIVDMMADLHVTLTRRERIEKLAREAVHRGVIDTDRLRRDEKLLGMVLTNRQAEV